MKPFTDKNVLDKSLVYMIYRVSRLIRLRAMTYFKRKGIGITPEQWQILLRLYDQEGRSQGELADSCFNDHSNITRMLDALEKQRFVIRTVDPDDRRKFLIFLTERAKAVVTQILPEMIAERESFFEHLNTRHKQALEKYLRIVEQNILRDNTAER